MAGKGQTKRKDKDRIVLRKGECQRKNGTYHYSWTDAGGKRHFVYAPTLEELREKEAAIGRDQMDGIKAEARYVTLNELFELWCQLKRGLKNNTFENYKGYIKHVHVASFNNQRRFPRPYDGENYKAFFDILRRAEYTAGNISIEGGVIDDGEIAFKNAAISAYSLLKQL